MSERSQNNPGNADSPNKPTKAKNQKHQKKPHRFERSHAPSVRWGARGESTEHRSGKPEITLELGWGRLIFAHTFAEPRDVAEVLRAEAAGRRDIAFYVRDPHVLLAAAPQELFLDPSHTFRVWLNNLRRPEPRARRYRVRQMTTQGDAKGIRRLYKKRHMVPTTPKFLWNNRANRNIIYLVAEDIDTGEIIGTTTGVDHAEAFGDPENGSSLWCLAVSPDSHHPGIGQALTLHLAEQFLARGRAYMDLSVLHDNAGAIALYEKLGFSRVPVFAVKRKNPINQPLFMGPDSEHRLNPYAAIIVTEARRRGIRVDVEDADGAYFALTHGGRKIRCRESLTELTSAIAMSRCDNKRVTSRLLSSANIRTPVQEVAGDLAEATAFLEAHERIVVKPAQGEQGAGIAVDVRDTETLKTAIAAAREECPTVLLESFHPGDDLRVVVIDYEVVAAAIRKPPVISGDGNRTAKELIKKLSRRRQAATDGESKIPMDAETERCLKEAGLEWDSVLEPGQQVVVRKTANLHTGGTLVDVTDELSETLRRVSRQAARALDIPVVGLDFLVESPASDDYVVIEANERPGLANHEPQPTVQRFIDLLFPETAGAAAHFHNHS